MIDGFTLAFAVGLFAVVSPCAIAFAVALAGLPVQAGDDAGARSHAASAVRAAVVMGICFAVVFAAAGLMVSAGIDRVFDVIPWIAAATGVALAAWGIRAAASRARPDPLPAAAVGAVYAIVAVPCMLTVFRSLVEQGVDVAGPGAAVAVTITFAAGAAAALAVPALAGAVVSRAAGAATRAGGVLVAAAGAWLVVYWLPSLFGGRIERGGAAESAANDVSAAVTEALARYELLFALVLLGISALALVAAVRPRTR